MKAKKSYGQHFLNSEITAQKIADGLIHTDQYRKVLEIGPGQGMLTKYLLEKPYDLLVVEADRDMVSYLNKHYPALKEHIIPADFLKLPLSQIFHNEPFAIIGNFPYNISSQILFKMLEYKESIPELVGMFQKEVAERVIAPPGNKTYGVISVLIQAFYEGTYLLTVDKSQFSPPPKVQSGVIRLTRRKNLTLDCDEKLFRKVVKQAFSQRRKMLRNTMKAFAKGHPMLEEAFFQQRPERLSVQDYVELTRRIESL
ncbi:MAG: ribosomal RNA small subunit methyltransferase A [Saprospiraceae bacterium]|nr:MAG: ribosomal RNA small subunit methyltransferase A [Saprospiraceae bacterium]